jgi:hypothetical protein
MNGTGRRWWVAALIVALCAVGAGLLPAGRPGHAQDGPGMAIDADPSNGSGPCSPVDAERTVAVGDTYDVAVCVFDPPGPPVGFDLRVEYPDDLVSGVERSGSEHALDDNPDANAGATTFGSPTLGSGWDCTGFGVLRPTLDDPQTPDVTDTVIVCNADILNPDAQLISQGVLATITFRADAEGAAAIELTNATNYGHGEGTVSGVTCGIAAVRVECDSAIIRQGAVTDAEATAAALTAEAQRPTLPPARTEPPGGDTPVPGETPGSAQTPGAGDTPGAGETAAATSSRATPGATEDGAENGGQDGTDDDDDDGGLATGWVIAIVVVAAVALGGLGLLAARRLRAQG